MGPPIVAQGTSKSGVWQSLELGPSRKRKEGISGPSSIPSMNPGIVAFQSCSSLGKCSRVSVCKRADISDMVQRRFHCRALSLRAHGPPP